MSNETWMNAKKALDWGFCDEILFEGKQPEPDEEEEPEKEEDEAASVLKAQLYSTRQMDLAILNRLCVADTALPEPEPLPVIGMDGKTENGAMPYEILKNQLEFLR